MSTYWRGMALPWGTTIASVFDPKDDLAVLKSSVLSIVLTNYGERCFVGETKVSLADGTEQSIADLARLDSEFYVYSYDIEKQRVVAGKAKAFATKEITQLVEVELDNGEKVRCTPDHRWMLRDGTYCEAQHLQPGTSLMPLYRKVCTQGLAGYELHFVPKICAAVDEKVRCFECGAWFKRISVSHLRTHGYMSSTPVEDYKRKFSSSSIAAKQRDGHWSFTHRSFASIQPAGTSIVHHKDCNCCNNTPTNLQWCSSEEHNLIHREKQQRAHARFMELMQDPAFRQWRRERVKLGQEKKWQDKEWAVQRAAELSLRLKETCCRPDFKIALKERAMHRGRSFWRDPKNAEWISRFMTASKNARQLDFAKGDESLIRKAVRRRWSAIDEKSKASCLRTRIAAAHTLSLVNAEGVGRLKAKKQLAQFHNEHLEFSESAWSRWRSRTQLTWPTLMQYVEPTGVMKVVNHKVVCVQHLVVAPTFVYDLCVEQYHNFALSAGVFVHNCMFPTFGSEVGGLLFEPSDAATLNGLRDRVRAAISRWDDRVTFVDFTASKTNNTLHLALSWTPAATAEQTGIQVLEFSVTDEQLRALR